MTERWWRDAVLYQVYPRSFADANGDGIGDLAGITARLDYLEWLGVDAIWLNPVHPSPNVDWGYDVADYTGIHRDFGTIEDLDELVAAAGRRGIRVLLDLVPNHSSNTHPWFRDRPDFYVWSDEIPNNWESIFGGGSAWAFDDERGRYYLHNFAPEQPDLDWWNPEVAREFEHILRFWFDRGVAGFRVDVAHAIFKDRELRDDPVIPGLGMRRRYSMFRPETHATLRDWRTLAETYDPPRLLLGEAYSLEVEQWAGYFGERDDQLDLAFAFMLTHADLDADEMRRVVAEVEAALPAHAWPCWAGSNHDIGRLASRWAEGDESRARCALLLLLTLRGTPCLYYGDELALTSGDVPRGAHRRLRHAVTRSRQDPDAVDARGRLARPLAAVVEHEPQRRGSDSGSGVDAPLHARPHRPATQPGAPADGTLRGAACARRRVGMASRRGGRRGAEPRIGACRDPRYRWLRRPRDVLHTRRRAGLGTPPARPRRRRRGQDGYVALSVSGSGSTRCRST